MPHHQAADSCSAALFFAADVVTATQSRQQSNHHHPTPPSGASPSVSHTLLSLLLSLQLFSSSFCLFSLRNILQPGLKTLYLVSACIEDLHGMAGAHNLTSPCKSYAVDSPVLLTTKSMVVICLSTATMFHIQESARNSKASHQITPNVS